MVGVFIQKSLYTDSSFVFCVHCVGASVTKRKTFYEIELSLIKFLAATQLRNKTLDTNLIHKSIFFYIKTDSFDSGCRPKAKIVQLNKYQIQSQWQ